MGDKLSSGIIKLDKFINGPSVPFHLTIKTYDFTIIFMRIGERKRKNKQLNHAIHINDMKLHIFIHYHKIQSH